MDFGFVCAGKTDGGPVNDESSVRPVFPGVLEWGAYSPEHKVELTSHAVRMPGDAWIVFDPTGDPKIWPGDRVDAVSLTNGNHDRRATDWSRHFGCPVWIPDGAGSEVAGARRYGEGREPMGNWETVSLDGGGPGEVAVRIPAMDLVVLGDAVVNLPGRSLELLPHKYCADPVRLRGALRALVATPFERVAMAHGAAIATGASRRIAALL
jgi:hypothetical protein